MTMSSASTTVTDSVGTQPDAVRIRPPLAPPPRHAILIEDTNVTYQSWGSVMTYHLAKRIWLLEGGFSQRELMDWAEAIQDGERLSSIQARITMAKVWAHTWQLVINLENGLSPLNADNYMTWLGALEAFDNGQIHEGELLLRDACLID